jgi:hypothetical protein
MVYLHNGEIKMHRDISDEELEFWLDGEKLIISWDDDLAGSSVSPNQEVIEKKSAGCRCKKCDNFFEYAEPNQIDGSFKCWGCRH